MKKKLIYKMCTVDRFTTFFPIDVRSHRIRRFALEVFQIFLKSFPLRIINSGAFGLRTGNGGFFLLFRERKFPVNRLFVSGIYVLYVRGKKTFRCDVKVWRNEKIRTFVI